ncbi:MAG: phosphoenolpyruvate--protein phosphotransferase [Phyllobacteriaceae bacterium]|nr:phosphoenolpyruvate--protein phosphotransferase [Phyllobacteriaceae bacterium]
MTKSLSFKCVLPNGVHARPASRIEELCNGFSAAIVWENRRTGLTADAKSALALIGTDTLLDDDCVVLIDGGDESQAFETLDRFIRQEFPLCDEALPPPVAANDPGEPLPRSLAALDPVVVRGRAVADGVAVGTLVALGGLDFDALPAFPLADVEAEEGRLARAVTALRTALEAQRAVATGPAADVLGAHLSLLRDVAFVGDLEAGVARGLGVAGAVAATWRRLCETLRASSSPLIRERELDIRDIAFQILGRVYGVEALGTRVELAGPSILIAEDLTPSRFLELDHAKVAGLLLGSGGTTSHTVILARSFGIPTLVGVGLAALASAIGEEVVLDAGLGIVVPCPSEPVRRYYALERATRDAVAARLARFRDTPAATADGTRIEIAANIALPIEAPGAFAGGAEAIGLFRTEMLYMDRRSPPTEDELYNAYVEALAAAAGKPLIVRTIDIGGDKPVDYLAIPAENNPFLGYRAVRIYAEFIELFRAQLRSILRASAHGSLRIMIPMISSLDEILWVKDVLGDVKRELRDAGIVFDEQIPFGIMLEVPSIAWIIDQCCEEVDFFSIGSNDLTQYLLAVDRDNDRVSKHYNSLNPAFLRALDHVVREVHAHGRWIGLCGELGAKGSVLPLLVGLGLDELSMSAPAVAATKAALARLDRAECRDLLDRAKTCRTALEVEHLLAEFRQNLGDAPMIAADCITMGEDLRSKEEVVKRMTDRLMLAGRCRYPVKLAEDVWAREDVFPTALGFGFAIPHAKSEHIEQSTISVARLPAAIPWGDDEVEMVIMLTLNKHTAGDLHMKIFSQLARRIMHEDFRAALFGATTPEAVEAVLRDALGPA